MSFRRYKLQINCRFLQHIIGHFWDKSFQSITSTVTDNLTRTTKRQNKQITQNNTTQKGALVRTTNSTTNTLKKSRQRQRTDRAWFSFVRHPARKQSGSLLTTQSPNGAYYLRVCNYIYYMWVSSSSMISCCSNWRAQSRAVQSLLEWALTLAPMFNSCSTVPKKPRPAATISGVTVVSEWT